jgi:ArsR family transcriptional regulator
MSVMLRDLKTHYLALANPTRLRIIARLARDGEMNVNDLARQLRVSQPRASWHLRMLRRARIVETRKIGREVVCSLNREAIREFQQHLDRLVSLPFRRPAAAAPAPVDMGAVGPSAAIARGEG